VNTLVAVALGGALGSASRHVFNVGVTRLMGNGFPWGILGVNVLGSFAIGFLSALLLRKWPDANGLHLFLTTGFLGGFTTFSAFALDVFKLMQAGQNSTAAIYVVASVALSIAAVFAGFMLLRGVA
jgi:fluoride exporter